jgi:hypothetical protein
MNTVFFPSLWEALSAEGDDRRSRALLTCLQWNSLITLKSVDVLSFVKTATTDFVNWKIRKKPWILHIRPVLLSISPPGRFPRDAGRAGSRFVRCTAQFEGTGPSLVDSCFLSLSHGGQDGEASNSLVAEAWWSLFWGEVRHGETGCPSGSHKPRNRGIQVNEILFVTVNSNRCSKTMFFFSLLYRKTTVQTAKSLRLPDGLKNLETAKSAARCGQLTGDDFGGVKF